MEKGYGAVRCAPVNKDGYWEVRVLDADSGEERTAAYIDSFTGRVLYVEDGARTDTDVQAAVQDKVRDIIRKHPLGLEELEKSYKDVLLFILAESKQESEFIHSLNARIGKTGCEVLLLSTLEFMEGQADDATVFIRETTEGLLIQYLLGHAKAH